MIGRVVSNYEIKALLAEGGMGQVYLAEHTIMGRRAAIKVLRGAFLDDKKTVARFLNEARATNAIGHPNIVEIIDVGFLPDGPPYLMMEFLEGETLRVRLKRAGRLDAAEVVRIVDQTASALEAAHAIGIIHRDLKPDNLFLVADPSRPGGERVKLVDFGVAKLLDAALAAPIQTSGVVLLGTPDYMSPEQFRGASADHRSDIYALGLILYEALCGRLPFLPSEQIDVWMMHIAAVPKPPRELFPDIPPHLESATLCALAKNPSARFQSMTDFRQALVARAAPRNSASTKTAANQESPVSPVGTSGGRRWVWLAAIVVAAAAIASWLSMARRGGPVQPPPAARGIDRGL